MGLYSDAKRALGDKEALAAAIAKYPPPDGTGEGYNFDFSDYLRTGIPNWQPKSWIDKQSPLALAGLTAAGVLGAGALAGGGAAAGAGAAGAGGSGAGAAAAGAAPSLLGKAGSWLKDNWEVLPAAWGAIQSGRQQGQANELAERAAALAERDYADRAPLREAGLGLLDNDMAGFGVPSLGGGRPPSLAGAFADPGNPYNRIPLPATGGGGTGPGLPVPAGPRQPVSAAPAPAPRGSAPMLPPGEQPPPWMGEDLRRRILPAVMRG